MLNKVLWMTVIASVFAVLRVAVPDLPIPEGLEAAIGVIVTTIIGWLVAETQGTVGGLKLKR